MIVFVSGSSKLKVLTSNMKYFLKKYMDKGASFIVGDCCGGDELAQNYLKEHNYEDVTVYCSTKTPRANRCRYDRFISLWNKAQGKTGEEFYQVKDKAMCEACDVALAFWNGTSYGVKCNIERCISLGKDIEVCMDDFTNTVLPFTDNKNIHYYFELQPDPITSMPHHLA